MEFELKQILSLEKIRSKADFDVNEIKETTLLAGESFSYQVCAFTYAKSGVRTKVSVCSELEEYIKLYAVRNVPCDGFYYFDDDVITNEPCLVPDLLVPLEEQNGYVSTEHMTPGTVWVKIDLPKNCKSGEYKITVTYSSEFDSTYEDNSVTMNVTVLPCELPEQSVKYTQWFYNDCIADYYNVPVYSEAHWELIDKFMSLARDTGINMILTPIITPPLDTMFGRTRTNVQLIKIEKHGEKYSFDFSLLDRWIDLAEKNGMKYFEMSHLFSQGGLKYAPNIEVCVDGKEEYLFGWHVPSTDNSYRDFLTQMLPELVTFLKEKGVFEKCYFHISDEPQQEHLEMYKYASSIVKPLVGEANYFDALSHIDFYEQGLVPIPVTSTGDLKPFLERKIPHQWAYYCCGQYNKLSNRYIFMPSYRNRILGLQLYKYNIEGFLHWGYNFYNSRASLYHVDPFVTTSGDRAFQSGNPFTVYPGRKGPLPSLRAYVFLEALQDVEVCRLLESFIGKDAVVKMIEEEAGMTLTFFEYPRNSEFVPKLMEKMKKEISKYLN